MHFKPATKYVVFCLLFWGGIGGIKASAIIEPVSIEGLHLQTAFNDVALSWPSAPRERFVVLCRTNAMLQTPWIVLTNQMRAFQNSGRTTFHDLKGLDRIATSEAETNLADLYRVFVIPDFWFNLNEAILCGGPKNPGEDFLPLYRGSKATDFLKPRISLLVDGEDVGADENIERVDFGTDKTPHWAYSTGVWFQHELIANGQHTLQLQTLLTLNNFVGDWSRTVQVSNAPVRVWVTNEINFHDFQPLTQGTNYTFVAHSAEPRVNWRMEVRDNKGHLLAKKTGQTINGEIRWKWDLRDMQGRLHDNMEGDPYFLSTITTWPLEEPKGSQRLTEIRSGQFRNCWWNERLGSDFVRKNLSMEERLQKIVSSEDDPLESQLFQRPYDFRKSEKNKSENER